LFDCFKPFLDFLLNLLSPLHHSIAGILDFGDNPVGICFRDILTGTQHSY
jgi:hypothetical protein